MLGLGFCFHKYTRNFLKKNNNKFYILFKSNWCSQSTVPIAQLETTLNLEETYCFDKIIYNDFFKKVKIKKRKKCENVCLSLKYISEDSNLADESNFKDEVNDNKLELVHFPYEIKTKFLKQTNLDKGFIDAFSESMVNLTPSDNEKFEYPDWNSVDIKINKSSLEDPKKWDTDNERNLENDNIEDIKFGTCNSNSPVSSIPCGGCGALLHCNNASIPGFLPKEVFEGKSDKELLAEICQRCHFLKEYDVALGVNVSPSEYPKLISQIKDKKALPILMIDLLDFPCSIWPGIMDLIGSRPVFIVGNKVDLFIKEGSWFLHHMKECLLASLEEQGIEIKNVMNVALISAKTGFGVEEFINKLHKHWAFKGDVYLVGCTNVGKSTLFNSLIQSDYCKVKATDLLQKATISAWPGTTLNLLKFPIMRPTGWRLYARTQRLIKEAKEKSAFEKLQKTVQNIRFEQIPLKRHVGRTFQSESKNNVTTEAFDNSLNEDKLKVFNPEDPEFVQSKWCYDTPGVVNQNQIVNLLTTSELLLTLPKSMIIPRNFHMKPKTSLFIGGLARLDYLEGTDFAWFTVYASNELPVTITNLGDADLVYKKCLGSNIFRVPFGGKDRLAKWPNLSSKKFEICGKILLEAVADLVLSSAGWVSITLSPAYRCKIEAWTPEGRGIYLRKPSVIKKGYTFKGDRIPHTPAFKTVMKEVKTLKITDKPDINFIQNV